MNVRGLRVARAIWRGHGAAWRWLGAALLVGGVALVFLSGWIDTSSGQDPAPATSASGANTAPTPPQSRGDDKRAAPEDVPASTDGKGNTDRESTGEGKGKGDGDGGAASEARGSIHEIADVKRGVITDPVGIHDTAKFGNGVQARLSGIEATEAEAFLPGEFSGPAVVVTVEVTNGSSEAINLDTVTVDLVFGDDLSATPVTDPEHTPLSGDLAAGKTTAGDYVFTLAPDEREDVQVRIKYAAETPTVVFAGSVADG